MAVGVGELSTLGVGKETTFGTLAPSIPLFHPLESLTPGDKNMLNPRPGSRGAPDLSAPATGPLGGSASLRVEAQPDVINQLLAFAMGTQGTPAPMIIGQGSLLAAVASGAHSVPINMISGSPGFGQAVVVGIGTANGELLNDTVGTNSNSLIATFGNAHNAGDKLVIVPTPANFGTLAAITGNASPQPIAYTTSGGAKPTVGQVMLVDYGAGVFEYVTVTAVAGSSSPYTVTGIFLNSHAANSKVAFVTVSTTAYSQLLTFGNLLVLPSFTLEENRGTIDTIDFLGATVDTVKLALDSGKNLQVDLTCPWRSFQKNASPTSPSLGTKFPFTMEALGSQVLFNAGLIGVAGSPPAVLKWDLTLNNQLDKTRYSAGNQRYVLDFPLGQRKISGTLTLGFESQLAQQIFWGTPGSATSPQQVIAGVPLLLQVGSQDYADVSNVANYLLQFIMPNIYLTGAPVSHKTSGALEQVCTFEAYSSSPGAGDALSIVQINKNATAY